MPQYPQVALAIDYILPAGFTGPLALEISDASGKIVRTVQASAGRGAPGGRGQRGGAATASGDPDDPDMRPAGRGRGGASAMTMRAGHNRFMWDYRWTNGPLVAPGRFNVSLIAGDPASSMPSPSTTRTFDVLVDPGVLKDGITPADLIEQQNFLLNLRDVQVQATQLLHARAAGDAEGRRSAAVVSRRGGIAVPPRSRDTRASSTADPVGATRYGAWHL